MFYHASQEKVPERAELARSNARKMQQYIETNECRRMPLLLHFDAEAKSMVQGTADCCDNCRGGNATDFFAPKEEANFASDSAIVFDAIDDFSDPQARTMLILHLKGSKAKELKVEMHSRPAYGKG